MVFASIRLIRMLITFKLIPRIPFPFIKDGYYGTVSGRSLAHQAGYVYSQDISAMYVGQVVDAQPGETVLDLCAAPGGKSTHIAQQLNNQGLLVSNEINHKRASILVENLERFGAKNVIILNEDPSHLAQNLKQRFDKVVVDAPCSGKGCSAKTITQSNTGTAITRQNVLRGNARFWPMRFKPLNRVGS